MKQNKLRLFTILLFIGLGLTLFTFPKPPKQSAQLPTDAPMPKDEPTGEFHQKIVFPPPIASLRISKNILGVSTPASEKRIDVDLTHQRVFAYEGNQLAYEFIVSTGKWDLTPTGEFTIWTKVRSQLMQGGSRDLQTYYYLPNVPYVLFFYNKDIAKIRGFSFHGTYWHDSFGHPMSHGDIDMRTEDAKTLYEWATPVANDEKVWSVLATEENPGTKVIIYGDTPVE